MMGTSTVSVLAEVDIIYKMISVTYKLPICNVETDADVLSSFYLTWEDRSL